MTGLNASSGASGEMGLNWTAPTNLGGRTIRHYVVSFLQTASDATRARGYQQAGFITTTFRVHTIKGLAPGAEYTFYVAVVFTDGSESAAVSIKRTTAGGSARPGAPTAVTARSIPDSARAKGHIALTWTPASGAGATGYRIEVKTPTGAWTTLDNNFAAPFPAAPAYAHNDVTAGTRYIYRVTAGNGNGTGPAAQSNWVIAGQPVVEFRRGIPDVTLIGPQEETIDGDNHAILKMPELYRGGRPVSGVTYKLTARYPGPLPHGGAQYLTADEQRVYLGARPRGAGPTLPPGLSFNPATRELTTTWWGGGCYQAELSWTATRGGATYTETFTVTNRADRCAAGSLPAGQDDTQQAGGNTAPVFVSGTEAQSATAGAAFSYTVPEARDDEDNTVTYRAELYDGTAGPLPAWLTFDESTRVLSGTPGADDTGTLDVLVTATDDGDPPRSATESFALTVKPAGVQQSPGLAATKPTANAGADQTGQRGGAVTLEGAGTLHSRGSQDALTYSWRIKSASNTALAGTGSRLSNANTATATWSVPKRKDMTDRTDVDDGQTVTFELTVTDGDGETATDTVTVTIDGSTWTAGGTEQTTEEAETEAETEDDVTPPTPTPPTANAGADQTGKRGGAVTLSGSGAPHAEGSQDALTYSWRIQSASNTALAATGSRLGDANAATATWSVPRRKDLNDGGDVDDGESVTFELTVTDGDGETAADTVTVTIDGSTWKAVSVSVADASAKETAGTIDFAVTLSAAARDRITVRYRTEDGTALAGASADYAAASGTLSFAPGQTSKTVSVAIHDDLIDDSGETFTLVLEDPTPDAGWLSLARARATGTITNSDPLQRDWLARFGRAAAADAVAAVTARFETPRGAGPHLTVGGRRLPLDGSGAGGAASNLPPMGGPVGASWMSGPRPLGSAAFRPDGLGRGPSGDGLRTMSGRELLMGTSFQAVLGNGAGARWTGWGQGASVTRFSGGMRGLSLSGETATGSMGMEYERGRLLTGFAMTHSVGAGRARGAADRTYVMGSSVTTALPYARFRLTERISAWSMAGAGSGRLTLDLDGSAAERYGADLAMTLAAAGMKGDLVTPAEAGGFALALKTDALWVRTESESVSALGVGNLAGAQAGVSRLRAMLDGSRTFTLAGGGTLTPSLSFGVRHDGGDAETGTGLELGAGLGWADPSRGLDITLRVYGLATHAERGYSDWGVSGQLRLAPGAAGRGLSMSLTPSYGADPGASGRLWAMADASALADNGDALLSSRLDGEVGYGVALFGGGYTGTPNVGFGLSDTARELRLGWRLAPAGAGAGDFELRLDAARREVVNDPGSWAWAGGRVNDPRLRSGAGGPEYRIEFALTWRW